jgi:hypothetical protein
MSKGDLRHDPIILSEGEHNVLCRRTAAGTPDSSGSPHARLMLDRSVLVGSPLAQSRKQAAPSADRA